MTPYSLVGQHQRVRGIGCLHLETRCDLYFDHAGGHFHLTFGTYLLNYTASHPRKPQSQYTKRRKFAAIVRQFLRQCCYAVKYLGGLGAFSVFQGYPSGTQASVSHFCGEYNRGVFQRVICFAHSDRRVPLFQYISLKALALIHLISLSLISPTCFSASPHNHQGLRISCCDTKRVVVYGCTSSIRITHNAFMFSRIHCRSCNTYNMFTRCYS